MSGITQRIDRITHLTRACRSMTPPVPRSVKIELTAPDTVEIDRAFYRRILKQMRDLGVEEIDLSYLGESFLCRWLPEAVRYAKKECDYPYVFLATNGRLATRERVRECMQAGLDSLEFSFDFSDAEVIQNLKEARRVRDEVEAATGHHCGLYASSIRHDDGQRARTQKAANEMLPYVDEHYWLPSHEQAGKTLPCWSLFTEGHITCDGRLSACGFDHDGRFGMGDLNYETFLEAWHSVRFAKLRRANLAEDVRGTVCEQCIACNA